MKKVLTVVPIRSGSVGVKNKNIKDLAGKPLVAHVLETLAAFSGQTKVVVSTDSPEYAEIAQHYGAEVPFLRPKELADGKTRLHHVCFHALKFFDEQGEKYDAVMSVQATVPFVTHKTIQTVIEKLANPAVTSVGTVSEIRHGHPFIAKKLLDDESDIVEDFLALENGTARYPRQVRPNLYFFNGSIFLRDRSLLENMDEDTNCMGNSPRAVLMDDIESINIDEELDFLTAEALFERILNGTDAN